MRINTRTSLPANHWKETLTAQVLVFSFLSKVIYENPTDDFINTLVSEDLFAEWPLDSDREEIQTGLKLLRTFSHAWRKSDLLALKRDYARLFIGPGNLLAPPWESVYLSKDHLLFEEQTMEVRHFYRKYGLQAPKPLVEPDDHLGLELAFLVHLCTLGLMAIEKGEAEELETSLQAQREFLSAHLLRWAPLCLEHIIKHAETEYYRGVAYLALGSLAETARSLDVASC